MTSADVDLRDTDLGRSMKELVERLFPICRSITGAGVRATLGVLAEQLPVSRSEVPSGTPVLDWTVPDEWNIDDAYIADATGRRIVDFRRCNLHVVSYSEPIDRVMSLDELRPHLHTLPDQPDVIPYRTTYYERSWGFCMSHRQFESLVEADYVVRIDSRLEPGSLTYGEVVVPGRTDGEVLISSHICHPSLADDNLSGIVVAAFTARRLLERARPPRLTHRFVFAPGTIGAITWLARNRSSTNRVRAGLTLTCLGDDQPFTYKRTIGGRSSVDRAAALALRDRAPVHELIDYFPYGYDERQYNSPGFRLPIGSLMRGRHGQFAEYHTSADDLSFVSGQRMVEALVVLESILEIIDADSHLLSREPFGEPQLGRRGLYRAIGGTDIPDLQMAMLWVLSLADSAHGLIDVAERSGLSVRTVLSAIDLLRAHNLLSESFAVDSVDSGLTMEA